MQVTVTAFQFGDEIAIRIPKKFGIKPGKKLEIRKISTGLFELIPLP